MKVIKEKSDSVAGVVEEASPVSAQSAWSSHRWIILSFLFTITVINFIDRQTVSVLAPLIRQLFHLSNSAYGRIVAAFQFGMMSGELPMGWVMDRWGCRLGLSAAVLWWSAATGAQAFVRSGTQLGIARFWMGTSECGNYSGGMKVVSQLFPNRERTLAIGIFNSGSIVGPVLAPPLIVFLAHHYGFRSAFLFPAALGMIWALAWWFTYRTLPARAEENKSLQVPLTALLKQSPTWAIMLCRFFVGPVVQFYWYWLPSYLYSARHLSLIQIGALSWIPYFLGGMGGVAGGWAAGWLQKQGANAYRVRTITMYSSAILCVASLAVPFVASTSVAFLTISLVIFAHNFLSANMYGAIIDLFPDNAVGRATGLSGVASGLSGLLFPLLTGLLVDHVSYKPVFILAAVMPLIGTIALFSIARKRSFIEINPSLTLGAQ
jgi:ACS family hexuronate transporter-like MFS transporter